MEKIINAIKARQNLGTLLNEVSLKNDQFIIERNGKPQAAVIPIWQFKQWKTKKEEFFKMIERVWQRNRKVAQKTLERELKEALSYAKYAELQEKKKIRE
jgi:prevent-host-death family protein